MEDIFNLKSPEGPGIAPIVISKDEFVCRSRAMLQAILAEYNRRWGAEEEDEYSTENDSTFDEDGFVAFMENEILFGEEYFVLTTCHVSDNAQNNEETETVTAEGWTPFMVRQPKLLQKILVMNSQGKAFYAIFYEHNGIDVHISTGNDYRGAWYRYATTLFPVWRPMEQNA